MSVPPIGYFPKTLEIRENLTTDALAGTATVFPGDAAHTLNDAGTVVGNYVIANGPAVRVFDNSTLILGSNVGNASSINNVAGTHTYIDAKHANGASISGFSAGRDAEGNGGGVTIITRDLGSAQHHATRFYEFMKDHPSRGDVNELTGKNYSIDEVNYWAGIIATNGLESAAHSFMSHFDFATPEEFITTLYNFREGTDMPTTPSQQEVSGWVNVYNQYLTETGDINAARGNLLTAFSNIEDVQNLMYGRTLTMAGDGLIDGQNAGISFVAAGSGDIFVQGTINGDFVDARETTTADNIAIDLGKGLDNVTVGAANHSDIRVGHEGVVNVLGQGDHNIHGGGGMTANLYNGATAKINTDWNAQVFLSEQDGNDQLKIDVSGAWNDSSLLPPPSPMRISGEFANLDGQDTIQFVGIADQAELSVVLFDNGDNGAVEFKIDNPERGDFNGGNEKTDLTAWLDQSGLINFEKILGANSPQGGAVTVTTTVGAFNAAMAAHQASLDFTREHFDGAGYLAANPDVAAAGIDPLAHYEANGYAEGREAHIAALVPNTIGIGGVQTWDYM